LITAEAAAVDKEITGDGTNVATGKMVCNLNTYNEIAGTYAIHGHCEARFAALESWMNLKMESISR